MLMKIKDRPISQDKRCGLWRRRFAGHEYVVNATGHEAAVVEALRKRRLLTN